MFLDEAGLVFHVPAFSVFMVWLRVQIGQTIPPSYYITRHFFSLIILITKTIST